MAKYLVLLLSIVVCGHATPFGIRLGHRRTSGIGLFGGHDSHRHHDSDSHSSDGAVTGIGGKVTSLLSAGVGVGGDGNGGFGVNAHKNVFGLNEEAGVGIGADGKVNVGFGIGLGGRNHGDREISSDSDGLVGVGAVKKVSTVLQGQADAEGDAQMDSHSHNAVGAVVGIGGKVTSGLGADVGVGGKVTSGLGAGVGVGGDGNGGFGVNAHKNVFGLNEEAGVGIGADGKVNVGFGIGLGGRNHGDREISSDSDGLVSVGAVKKVSTGLQGQADAEGDAQMDSHSHNAVGAVVGIGGKVTSGLGADVGVGEKVTSGLGAGVGVGGDGNGGFGVNAHKNVFGLNEEAGVGIGADGKVNVGFGIGLGGRNHGDREISSDSDGLVGVGAVKKVSTVLQGQADAEGDAQMDSHSHNAVGAVVGIGRKVTSGLGADVGVGGKVTSGLGAGVGVGGDGNGGFGVNAHKNVFGLNEEAGVGIGADGKVNVGFGIGLGGRNHGDREISSDSDGLVGVGAVKKVSTVLQGQADAEGDAQMDSHSHNAVGAVVGIGGKVTSGLSADVGVGGKVTSGLGAGVGVGGDGNGGFGVNAHKNVFGLNEEAGVGIGADGKVNVGFGIGLGGRNHGDREISSDSDGLVGVGAVKKVSTVLQGQADAEGDAQMDSHSHNAVGAVVGIGGKVTSGLGADVGVGEKVTSGLGAGVGVGGDGNGGFGVNAHKNVFGLNEEAGVGIGADGKVNVGFGIGLGGRNHGDREISSDSDGLVGVGAVKKVSTVLQGQADAEGDAQMDSHSHNAVGAVVGIGGKVTSGLSADVGVGGKVTSGLGAGVGVGGDGNGGFGVNAHKNVFGLNEEAGVGIGADGKVNVGFGIGLGGRNHGDREISSDSDGLVGVGAVKKVSTVLQGQADAEGDAQMDSHSHNAVGAVVGIGGKVTSGLSADVGVGGKVTSGLGAGVGVGGDGNGGFGVNAHKNVFGLNEEAGVGIGADGKVNVGFGIGLGGRNHGDREISSDSDGLVGVGAVKKVSTVLQGQADAEGDAQMDSHSHNAVGAVVGVGGKVTSGLGAGVGVGGDGNGGFGVNAHKNVFGLNEEAGVGIGGDGKVNVGFGIGFRGGSRRGSGGSGIFRIGYKVD